jgi:hypothetical protein
LCTTINPHTHFSIRIRIRTTLFEIKFVKAKPTLFFIIIIGRCVCWWCATVIYLGWLIWCSAHGCNCCREDLWRLLPNPTNPLHLHPLLLLFFFFFFVFVFVFLGIISFNNVVLVHVLVGTGSSWGSW